MANHSPAGQWDQRYGTEDYWYGRRPNDFVKDPFSSLPPRGHLLGLAEGEGRDAVCFAARGFEVVAVDASAVGLAKAERLAQEQQVYTTTLHADLSDYRLGHHVWDPSISIWCHLPPALSARVHHAVGSALRVGGVFLLEAYTPAQLEFKTGGPPTAEPMPTPAQLRTELAGLTFAFAIEREREVREGRGQRSCSAVVQVIARRLA